MFTVINFDNSRYKITILIIFLLKGSLNYFYAVQILVQTFNVYYSNKTREIIGKAS